MGNSLVLFTSSFPFGDQEAFLESELPYLSKEFQEIIIIPHHCSGKRRETSPNTKVELSFSHFFSQPKWKQVLPRFFNALKQWKECPKSLNTSVLKHYASYLSMAETYNQLLGKLINQRPDLKGAIFYSYWFHVQASGIALFKEKNKLPELKFVSRAHGFDLYEDRSPVNVFPLRERTLAQTSLLFPVSDSGSNYLKCRYPASNPYTMRLGVHDPGFSNPGSDLNHFSIVSCSNLVKLKRVHLIISALKNFVSEHKELNISWHHIGNGPEYQNLVSQARAALGKTINWVFHGNISNHDLYSFYKTTPVDVFVHLSETEGIPVSLMEAFACGIPAIATSVGGVPEIVNNKNGVLLEANPSPQQVAQTLGTMVKRRTHRTQQSLSAKETWHNAYQAESNYSAFIKKIKNS